MGQNLRPSLICRGKYVEPNASPLESGIFLAHFHWTFSIKGYFFIWICPFNIILCSCQIIFKNGHAQTIVFICFYIIKFMSIWTVDNRYHQIAEQEKRIWLWRLVRLFRQFFFIFNYILIIQLTFEVIILSVQERNNLFLWILWNGCNHYHFIIEGVYEKYNDL